MYKKILQIQSLKLPDELNNLIYINYKYSMLEDKYKKDYNNVLNFLKHYIFLNKKINKKNHKEYSLLDTIKYFD
jgi:hypothetical protein|tara:strand:+ start:611 stop:832 length:222 start_codon:yes stop_codon:yes gene_type:complete